MSKKRPIQFSLLGARGARDAAMEAAEENAYQKWKAEALKTIRRVALEMDFFTVDRVQELMQLTKLDTHDNRAMGPMMLEARRRGWIESTRQTVQSTQKHCHANPRTLWRSKLNGQV